MQSVHQQRMLPSTSGQGLAWKHRTTARSGSTCIDPNLVVQSWTINISLALRHRFSGRGPRSARVHAVHSTACVARFALGSTTLSRRLWQSNDIQLVSSRVAGHAAAANRCAWDKLSCYELFCLGVCLRARAMRPAVEMRASDGKLVPLMATRVSSISVLTYNLRKIILISADSNRVARC